MDRNDLIELADYNAWATSRLAAAVLELTPEEFAREIPSSFPSVRETTAHLVAAEELWVERWHEKPPRPITMPDELPADAPALVARWKAADASALAFLRGPYDLERPLPIRTTTGKSYTHLFREMVPHLANHQTHHRGQLVTMLRQLGKKPPGLDLIAFHRERSARAS